MRMVILMTLVFVSCLAHQTRSSQEITYANEWRQQKEFFQEHGYLWIKNFFSEAQVKLLEHWAEEINVAASDILALVHQEDEMDCLPKSIPGSLIVVPERANPFQVCRAEDLLTCYPDLHHFVEGNVTSFLSKLLEEPYTLFKDKINFKWPGGGAFLPHQDYPAFSLFGPNEHVTAMICIDPATEENGCLQVAKNWKKSLKNTDTINSERLANGQVIIPYIEGGAQHGSIQNKYVKEISWLKLKTSPGDLVLIDSYVPHYSEPNKSSSSRRAMFFTLNRLQEGEYRKLYYYTKRQDPNNPLFHFATPTKAKNK